MSYIRDFTVAFGDQMMQFKMADMIFRNLAILWVLSYSNLIKTLEVII